MRAVLIIYLSLQFAFISHGQFNAGDQDGAALTDSRFQDFFTDIRNNVRKYDPDEIGKKIKGSPYLTETFALGSIRFKDDLEPKKFFLRYNAYNDEIEIGTEINQKTAQEAVLKRNNIICTIGNDVFIYSPFLNKKNKPQLGYLTPILKKSSITLYERKKKNFKEETIPRTSLERGFPPRFIDEVEYFLSIRNKTPIYLGNSIKEAVKNLPESLKKEAKKNAMNLKKIKHKERLVMILTQLDEKIK